MLPPPLYFFHLVLASVLSPAPLPSFHSGGCDEAHFYTVRLLHDELNELRQTERHQLRPSVPLTSENIAPSSWRALSVVISIDSYIMEICVATTVQELFHEG